GRGDSRLSASCVRRRPQNEVRYPAIHTTSMKGVIMATKSTAKRWKRSAAATVLLSAAVVGLVATPAAAATISWNYSAPNCTGTTITGKNWNAAPWFRGSTTRTQDICPIGTVNYTRLTLLYGDASAVWSTAGTN